MSRELDALVAEKVMGWVFPFTAERFSGEVHDHWNDEANKTLYLPDQLPWFTSNASDDYEVLKHVRKNWSRREWLKFSDLLGDIWGYRASVEVSSDFGVGSRYEPGDYSKAALKALGALDG